MYLESARFEQHDLIMLAKSLEARDALCKLHYFFNSRGEALGERLPHFLTGATGRSHGTWIEWTCLQGRRREERKCYGLIIDNKSIDIHIFNKKKQVSPALWLLHLASRGRDFGSGNPWLGNCSDWRSRTEMIGCHWTGTDSDWRRTCTWRCRR